MMIEFRTLNYLYKYSALMIFLPLLCSSQATNKSTKAKFYEMPDGLGTPSGACGYGEYGRSINNGSVAAVSSRFLYKSGAGCGACYQVKCKALECNNGGVNVVVTDNASTDEAELILSYHAFTAMAKPGNEKALKDKGIVDIQYKRIKCEYGAEESLRVKVLEHSTYPYYLAFMFLYQGGISPITAVEIFEVCVGFVAMVGLWCIYALTKRAKPEKIFRIEYMKKLNLLYSSRKDSIEWKACSRAYGAVWHILSPPKSALTLRVFLPGGSSSKPTWMLLPNAIPDPWTPGASYHTSLPIP